MESLDERVQIHKSNFFKLVQTGFPPQQENQINVSKNHRKTVKTQENINISKKQQENTINYFCFQLQ